jgi:hypothetical protein
MPPRCCVGALSQGAQSTESLVLPGRRSDALEPVDLSFQRLRKFVTRTAVPPRQHDVGHTSRRSDRRNNGLCGVPEAEFERLFGDAMVRQTGALQN